jgi:arsenate reductase
LENAIATAAALAAIIVAFGPVSGAHLNPVVTVMDVLLGGIARREAAAYIFAQFAGAACGAVLANVMFSRPALELATRVRSGGGLWLAEVVATSGLLFIIFGSVRGGRTSSTPFVVGSYIGAAYFFTSSTSFANPAVTVARALSDSFAGISPTSVPAFVLAQLVGLAICLPILPFLFPKVSAASDRVVVPRADDSESHE